MYCFVHSSWMLSLHLECFTFDSRCVTISSKLLLTHLTKTQYNTNLTFILNSDFYPAIHSERFWNKWKFTNCTWFKIIILVTENDKTLLLICSFIKLLKHLRSFVRDISQLIVFLIMVQCCFFVVFSTRINTWHSKRKIACLSVTIFAMATKHYCVWKEKEKYILHW